MVELKETVLFCKLGGMTVLDVSNNCSRYDINGSFL